MGRGGETAQQPQAPAPRKGITLKSRAQIEQMRAAGRIVREVLNLCHELAVPGATTLDIDLAAADLIAARNAEGLFKGYQTGPTVVPFPGNLCISINDVVVHGFGDETVLKDGDIVGVDCGVRLDGWCGDAATTIMVGHVSDEVKDLCDATQHVLRVAIEHIKPGRRWSQIARVMQNIAEARGYGVVRDFVGHGVGQTLHEDPKLPNFVNRELIKNDIHLREGMTLAIEPMCNLGTRDVRTLSDGWTVVTADGRPSAHYEHTIAIVAGGAEILTDGN